jgi:hypothetical protein
MHNNGRYVSVYFDETLWNFWSLSWFASFYEFAKFDGTVLVVDGGIPERGREFLKSEQAEIVPLIKKHNVPELDVVHTLAAYSKDNKGTYAFWDCVSYFQDSIEPLFEEASSKLVCCREATAPQPSIRPTLDVFGLTPAITTNVAKLYAILKKVAKKHSRTLYGGFFASPDNVLRYYDTYIDFCIDSGFLSVDKKTHQTALNMFLLSFDNFGKVLDNKWASAIANQLQWKNDGFYEGDNRVGVVYIPNDMQYSAESAVYHFRNRFPAIHDEWKCRYKGNTFTPKRVMKPSLGKLKKVT